MNTKNVMFGCVNITIVDLDANSGRGTFSIDSELYHEYQLTLKKLMRLRDKVLDVAGRAGISV